jgi:hypothetical protein
MDSIPGQDMIHPAEERRRLQRFDLTLHARIEELSHPPDRTPVALDLMTKDVSARGAFLPSVRLLEEGTRVKIELTVIPRKRGDSELKGLLVYVNGTVVRKEPSGMAVCFDKRYSFGSLSYI